MKIHAAASSISRIGKTEIPEWVIELTDLSMHQKEMGYPMSGDVLMINITPPEEDQLISMHSMPLDEWFEFSIPLPLHKINLPLKGSLCFRGLDSLPQNWKFSFVDNRTKEKHIVNSEIPVYLTENKKVNYQQNLELVGYTGSGNTNLFELLISKNQR